MRLVLRFETDDGCGVYSGASSANFYVDSERHPLPEFDAGLAPWWNCSGDDTVCRYLFGFATLEQARAWFYNGECLQAIQHEGCKLVVYAVPGADVIVGYSQTVFNPATAQTVAEFKPLELHNKAFEHILQALNDSIKPQDQGV